MHLQALSCLVLFSPLAWGANFAYESVVLREEDTKNFPAIAFGDVSNPPDKGPRCKVEPGDPGWPSHLEWAEFNKAIGGRLLAPSPAAAACYPGNEYNETQCEFLLGAASQTRFYSDDPLTVFTEWPEGNTCEARLDPTGECTLGGFPYYVVNASSVRDIQVAVNFARNNHIRLIVKNTGHDFVGRSAGRGALSVWVHHLKGIEYLRDYSIGEFEGQAARIGTGTEGWEIFNVMNTTEDFTLASSGATTLGVAGGWSQGGGHGLLSSLYGLGADQYLSFNIVTADGRFITADVNQNRDIFFAVRGGGGGTYGIVTSAIFKAYPGGLNLGGAGFAFITGPKKPDSLLTASPFKPAGIVEVPDAETFWRGFNIYLNFSKIATAAGAYGFGDLNAIGNDSFTFIGSFLLPNMTSSEVDTLLAPLFQSLRDAGLDMPDSPAGTTPYAFISTGVGDVPGSRLFSSRLFPATNWDSPEAFGDMTAAIRRTVSEGGYLFRGRNIAPSLSAAGYPGESAAINPAFRHSLMHATVFAQESLTSDTTPTQWVDVHDRLDGFVDGLRTATPGGGAYLNEADVLEPGWQESFFGSHYPRLAKIKKAVDPWGLFWAPTTPGSEAWKVNTGTGVPTQNGPLCRVK